MARTKRDGIRARNAKLWEDMLAALERNHKRNGYYDSEWRAAFNAMCDEYERLREKYPTYKWHVNSGIRQGIRKNMNRKDRHNARNAIRAGRYDDVPLQQSGRNRVNWEAM